MSMSWLRRLSRDRSSKSDSSPSMPNRPGSFSTNDNQGFPFKDTQYSSTHNSQDKLLTYRASVPQDHQFNSPPQQRPPGTSSDAMTMHTAPTNLTSASDLLTKAFNEAIKPYLDQIETLKGELEDMTLQIQQLEDERADMHAWIDKRHLRAGESSRLSHHQSIRFPDTNLPLCRRPSIRRCSNEHRSLSSTDPKLPHRSENDSSKPRPSSLARLPILTPPNLHVCHNPRNSNPLYRKPVLSTRRATSSLRTYHQARGQPQ